MKIKLLDGKEIEFEKGQTGLDIAKSISTSLAKSAIAYQLDDKVYDLNREIMHDGNFNIIKKGDKESYNVLNHSTSHLMAEAIHNLYPKLETKNTIYR